MQPDPVEHDPQLEDVTEAETSGEEDNTFSQWNTASESIYRRWRWLEHRITDLEALREGCYDIYRRVRRAKQKFTPLFESGHESHAARCVPIKLPKRGRKIVKLSRVHDARFTTPSAVSLLQHPLMFTTPACASSVAPVADNESNELQSPAPLTSPLSSSALSTPTTANREGSVKKRHLRASDYDIDNIVVPTSMFQSARITPVKPAKQIFTPQFRLAPVLPPSASNGTPAAADSSDEDTDDEAFYKLHYPLEVEERKKYLLKPGDKAALKNEQLPSQLYIRNPDDLVYAAMSPLQSPIYINNCYLDSRTDSAKTLTFPSASAPITPLRSMPKLGTPKSAQRAAPLSQEHIKRKFSAMWNSKERVDDYTTGDEVSSGSDDTDSEDDAVMSDELLRSDGEDEEEEVDEDDEDVKIHSKRSHSSTLVMPTQGMNTRHSATRRPSTLPASRGRGRPRGSGGYKHANGKRAKLKSSKRGRAPRVQWVIANDEPESFGSTAALHSSLSLPSLDVSAEDLEPDADALAAEDIAAAATAVLGPPPSPQADVAGPAMPSSISQAAALALEHAGPVCLEPASDPNSKPRLVLRLRRVVI